MLTKVLRWFLGIALLVWGMRELYGAFAAVAGFDADLVVRLVVAVGAIAVAALLVARDLARVLSRPLLLLIENLYMPGNRNDKPPLSFRLARYYAVSGRLPEAEREYLRMLRFHPGEAEGWIELMTLYWTWSRPARRHDARRACARGLRKVTVPAMRIELARALAELEKGRLPVDLRKLALRDKERGGAHA